MTLHRVFSLGSLAWEIWLGISGLDLGLGISGLGSLARDLWLGIPGLGSLAWALGLGISDFKFGWGTRLTAAGGTGLGTSV